MPIYTRTGDTGSTSLFGGVRVSKSDDRVDVYGSIDELNSWVGLIVGQLDLPEVQKFLFVIQSDLFTAGSVLAGWKKDIRHFDERIREMELRIDLMEKELPKLTNFILPGGSLLGSYMHISRSICRRAERLLVNLALQTKGQAEEKDMKIIIKYLNRLSDLFFQLARFINKHENVEEVIWSGIPRRKINK